MTQFTYRMAVRGTNGKETVKSYDLGDFATGTTAGDFDAALAAAVQIKGAFLAVSDGVVAQEQMVHWYGADNSVPAAADIFEEGVLTLGLVTTDGSLKKGTSNIPAPKVGIFVAATGDGRDLIDINDTDLQQYVQQLEQHTQLSDGDVIDTGAGASGLIRGVRRTRKGRMAK